MKGIGGFFGLVFACLVSEANAEHRWIIGVGLDDLKNYRDPGISISVDYEFGKVLDRPLLKWRIGSTFVDNGNVWAGAGVAIDRPIRGGPWFWDASFLAGPFYRKNESPDIGDVHFPMFRTQLGIGRALNRRSSISVALTHYSDGGLDEDAGSSEAINLLYGIRY